MTKIARERNMTAREAAKRFGKSPRTIRRYVAMDRQDYLDKAASRRQRAVDLREKGLKWAEVAEKMGCSVDAVKALARRHTS